jgi:hypothetical protein
MRLVGIDPHIPMQIASGACQFADTGAFVGSDPVKGEPHTFWPRITTD